MTRPRTMMRSPLCSLVGALYSCADDCTASHCVVAGPIGPIEPAWHDRVDLLERAILATREALTETARRDVYIYLTCELDEPDAAEAWHQLALGPQMEDEG